MQRKTDSGGFSLMEVMVVVVIIGLLAAIALPAYQRYIARAQVSEAMVLFGAARTAVNDLLGQTGQFPVAGEASLTAIGMRTSGKYVEKVESDGTSQLVATFRADVSPLLAGKTVVYTIDLSNTLWACGSGGSNPLEDPLLSAACRN